MGLELDPVVLCTFCGAEGHDVDECDEAYEHRRAEEDRQLEEDVDILRNEAALEELAARAEAARELEPDQEPEPDYEIVVEVEHDEQDTENDRKRYPKQKGDAKKGEFERGDQTEIAAAMIKKLTGKGPALVYDDGALHRYEPKDGLWHVVDADAQNKTIQSFAGATVAESKSKSLKIGGSDVRNAIFLAAAQVRVHGWFQGVPMDKGYGLAFSDGYAVVDKKGTSIKVQEHASSNRARWGYEFPFVEDPRPKMFIKFLEAVFHDDEDREQKIQFVQEFGGIAMLGIGPQFQKCLVATSFTSATTDGQNGKSQLATVLQGIMPAGSVSSTRPQDFDNEYRRAGLAGKLLNCVGEMPEGEIMESASFKAIITGDRIEGRHIREAPIQFYPRASHYYACNTPPGTSDFSRAFFRRFVFLTFNRVFKETDPDFVVNIGDKILTAERAILPSWHLRGALRVLQCGHYTHVPSSDKAILEWRKGVDQVELFFVEKTVLAKSPKPGRGSDWTPAWQVYDAYKTWTDQTGHKPLASNKFGARAAQTGRPHMHTKWGHHYPVKLI